MYKATVIPTLLYGCEAWILSKKHSEQLEQTQNEIIKTDIKNCKVNTKTSITYGNINYPNKIPNLYKANGISTQSYYNERQQNTENYLYYQILQPELNQKFMSIGQQWINSMKEYNFHYTIKEVGKLTKTQWCNIV